MITDGQRATDNGQTDVASIAYAIKRLSVLLNTVKRSKNGVFFGERGLNNKFCSYKPETVNPCAEARLLTYCVSKYVRTLWL